MRTIKTKISLSLILLMLLSGMAVVTTGCSSKKSGGPVGMSQYSRKNKTTIRSNIKMKDAKPKKRKSNRR